MNNGETFICGIDEAGRGPLAGPVCAAAVILPREYSATLGGVLNDSKKMSAAAREEARLFICREAYVWGIGWASAAEIDEINILRASLLAMKRAFHAMPLEAENGGSENHALFNRCAAETCPAEIPRAANIRAVVDGLFVPDIPVPREALVKADSKVPEVMAASILAKTARDRLMEYYGLFYPEYGYEKHKGYPTKAHREAVLRFGPSPIQRMTFAVKA